MTTLLAASNPSHSTGSKYQADLDIKTIAQLVRGDIKAAGLAGVSVRISRYSMGQSLTIKAKVSFPVRHGSVEQENLGRAQGLLCPWMTREGYELQAALEKIGNAYNYDRSDSMTDHFDTNYYLHVVLEVVA